MGALYGRLSSFLHSRIRERRFKEQFTHFAEVSKAGVRRWLPQAKDLYPCLDDATASTGFDRHYIYHPAWAARVLAKTRPTSHVDVSSTLHFCSIVSAFVPVEFYDFRPAPLVLSGLSSKAADVTQLQWASDSVASLSCMHVIEHIGLGRYGDPVDPDGDLKAIAELVRVLRPGGDLLIAVPVGKSRICFNAHRIYDSQEFARYFTGLELVEFSLIPDGEAPDGMLESPAPDVAAAQRYGCGCFWLKKPLRA